MIYVFMKGVFSECFKIIAYSISNEQELPFGSLAYYLNRIVDNFYPGSISELPHFLTLFLKNLTYNFVTIR